MILKTTAMEQNGHKNLASLLIDRGASVDKATEDGQTPLYVAARVNIDNFETLF